MIQTIYNALFGVLFSDLSLETGAPQTTHCPQTSDDDIFTADLASPVSCLSSPPDVTWSPAPSHPSPPPAPPLYLHLRDTERARGSGQHQNCDGKPENITELRALIETETETETDIRNDIKSNLLSSSACEE